MVEWSPQLSRTEEGRRPSQSSWAFCTQGGDGAAIQLRWRGRKIIAFSQRVTLGKIKKKISWPVEQYISIGKLQRMCIDGTFYPRSMLPARGLAVDAA